MSYYIVYCGVCVVTDNNGCAARQKGESGTCNMLTQPMTYIYFKE